MCYFILLGEDHHVVELPGTIIEGCNISIHIRMLAQLYDFRFVVLTYFHYIEAFVNVFVADAL